jgi:hypothetical protein
MNYNDPNRSQRRASFERLIFSVRIANHWNEESSGELRIGNFMNSMSELSSKLSGVSHWPWTLCLFDRS